MSNARNVEERTEKLLAPIAEAAGVRIYDVEFVKEAGEQYLRAFIDKDGGVNIGDCETVSRALSDALDAEDFIPEAYTLEVSSPGLGRALRRDRHLAQSIGEEVEIRLYKAIDKQKDFGGVLEAFDAETLTLSDPESGERKVWNRSDIAVIRLALDF